jgi:hypothetical protein
MPDIYLWDSKNKKKIDFCKTNELVHYEMKDFSVSWLSTSIKQDIKVILHFYK